MDRWLEAYATWPSGSQMMFSIIVLIIGLIFAFLLGIWFIQIGSYVAVWLRGWPNAPPRSDVKTIKPTKLRDSNDKTKVSEMLANLARICDVLKPVGLAQPMDLIGHDWRAEQERMAEEQKYQAKLQADMEQMEQMSPPTPPPPASEVKVPKVTLSDVLGPPPTPEELKGMAKNGPRYTRPHFSEKS